MNLQSSEDWEILCKTTPTTINGVHYNGATSCFDQVSNSFKTTYIFRLKLNNRESGESMGFGSCEILIAVENYATQTDEITYEINIHCYPPCKQHLQ